MPLPTTHASSPDPSPDPSSVSQDPAAILNLQNRSGETTLGWVLKFAASGLLPEPATLKLTKRMLDLGALATLPAFEERVRGGAGGGVAGCQHASAGRARHAQVSRLTANEHPAGSPRSSMARPPFLIKGKNILLYRTPPPAFGLQCLPESLPRHQHHIPGSYHIHTTSSHPGVAALHSHTSLPHKYSLFHSKPRSRSSTSPPPPTWSG